MDKATPTLWILTTFILKGGVLAGDWSINLPINPLCAVAGSTVVLPCSYDYPERSSRQGSVSAEQETTGKEGHTHKVLSEMWCLGSSRCITQSYVFHSAGIFADPAYNDRVKYLGKPGTKNCSLQISGLRRSDGGTYVFYVITSHPTQKMPPQPGVRLLVADSPYAVAASVSPCGVVMKGDSVRLACCCPEAGPAGWYRWFMDHASNGTTVREHPGQVWTMNEAQPNSSGTYFCQVHTAEGSRNSTTVTIDVQYPPHKTAVTVLLNGSLTEGAVLTCSSDANPLVHTYAWYQGPVCRLTADRITEALATPIGMDQTLHTNTTTGEMYCCVATNDLGSHRDTLKPSVHTEVDTKLPSKGMRSLIVGTTTVAILVVVGIVAFALRWKLKASSPSQSYALTETTIPIS